MNEIIIGNKIQNQINYHFEQLKDPKNWEPRKQYITIEAIFYLYLGQRFDLDSNMMDGNFDNSNSIRFYRQKYKAYTDNQDNLIELAKRTMFAHDCMESYIASGRISLKETYHQNTHEKFGMIWNKILHLLGHGKKKKSVKKLLEQEDKDEIRKKCPDENVKFFHNTLLNLLQNDFRRRLQNLDDIFDGGSRFCLTSLCLEEIVKETDHKRGWRRNLKKVYGS